MVWDVPKSEKLDLNVFFSSYVREGYVGKSQFILENIEHYKKITNN